MAPEAHHLGATGGLDADRHDCGLHLVDDVGKSHRALDALGISDRAQRWVGRLREKSCAAEQHGHAKAGDASKQNETTRREDARFLSWNAHSHNGHSIFGAAAPRGTRCTARWATLPYRVLSKKLNFGKVGKLQKIMESQLLVLVDTASLLALAQNLRQPRRFSRRELLARCGCAVRIGPASACEHEDAAYADEQHRHRTKPQQRGVP